MALPQGYTGHARDFAKGSVVADPKIEITSDVRILMRRDGRFVIFDKRLPLGENAGEFATAEMAETEARRKYANEIKPKGPAKQSASDDELFAAMKRAMANGFRTHAPAWSPEELLEAAE